MVLDLIAFGFLSLAHFGILFSAYFLFLSSAYLIGKWFVFRDVMSALDMISGIYIILVLFFHVSGFMYYFILGWFAYKLVFVLVSS